MPCLYYIHSKYITSTVIIHVLLTVNDIKLNKNLFIEGYVCGNSVLTTENF